MRTARPGWLAKKITFCGRLLLILCMLSPLLSMRQGKKGSFFVTLICSLISLAKR